MGRFPFYPMLREKEHCPGDQTQHFHLNAKHLPFEDTFSDHKLRHELRGPVAAWLSSRGESTGGDGEVGTGCEGDSLIPQALQPWHLLLLYLPVAPWGAGAGLSMCPASSFLDPCGAHTSEVNCQDSPLLGAGTSSPRPCGPVSHSRAARGLPQS